MLLQRCRRYLPGTLITYDDAAAPATAQTRLLFDLTRSVSVARELEEIYDAALDCLAGSLGTDRAAILLFDHDDVMRFKAWRGLSDEYRAAVEGHSPWTRDTADPAPVLVSDVREDAGLEDLRPVIEAEGIRSLAFIPLQTGARLLGKFMVYYAEPRNFSDLEMMAAQTIAAQVAFAVDQHRAREVRGHLTALYRSAGTGIASIGLDGRFLEVNDRFCELTARTRRELLSGLDWYQVTDPEDAGPAAAALEALMRDTPHVTFEQRLVRPGGTTLWASTSISALTQRDGTVTGALAVVTDITERRLMDELVYESERRYRTLIEALGVAVYTCDADGFLTLYNEAAADLWGRHPELGVDRWCGSWRIFQPDGTPMETADCPMGVALREDRMVRGVDILVERPDGERRNVLPHPTPLHDSHGRVIGAVNVLVDITGLKRAEDAMLEALRAKDDFLGQVSHELRTPLTQLIGNAHILVHRWQALDDETRAESLSEIHIQSQRMQRLIDNMMVLSRIERGMMPETEPQLIQRLLEKTLGEFCQRFPATVVDVRIPPDLPPVETSAATIDQVVWNLLTNAQKYGPAEGPIHVTGRATPEWVELTVRDHGPGVPEADMPRLFEPYFRSNATAEAATGLGLGLSVCRRLLESQRGELWAGRVPSGGMEFGLRMPLLDG